MTQSNHPYKGGTIKSIKLVNFMCHDSFELELGPKVNFIIGPNGSGKSALLTALVVALGGRATTTNRAKRANEFVMYGKSSAKISVVIHNYSTVMEKESAFKPDDYGKSIVVEKTIFRDEARNCLVMRNDKDKKVSERSHELHEMLDHFGILINNPICILNQEISKTFLHSKRPEDKFDLFMKATNLEQIEQDYDSAQKNYTAWDETNLRKVNDFKMLDHEYTSCQEKTTFLENRAKLNDKLESLNQEYLWATIRDTEEASEELNGKIRKIDSFMEDAQKAIDQRMAKIKEYQDDVQVMRDKILTIQEKLDSTRKKLIDIRSKETLVKTKKVDLRSKVEHCERTILRHASDKAHLEKSIEELKNQYRDQNALDQDNEVRKLRIEALEREIKADAAREKCIRQHSDQLSMSMTTIRTDLTQANTRANQHKDKIFQSQTVVRRLKNGQENTLRRYGDPVIRLREEIEKAHSQGKFKCKPIGPLGHYLKLKTPEVAGALEIHLGRNAHAFACDNHKDMTTLSTICKKLGTHYREFRQPVIITRPFVGRFDVTRFRAYHPRYKTLLDHVDIDEDVVHNALVDRASIECALFVAEYFEAESLMIDVDKVPKFTRCAYTLGADNTISVMHPNTLERGYKSITHRGQRGSLFSNNNAGQIKELEREIERYESQLRLEEQKIKDIQQNLTAQRKDYDDGHKEIKSIVANLRQKEDELLALRTMIIQEPQELSALESELEKIELQSETEKVNLEQHRESLVAVDSELDDILAEKQECHNLLKKHEEERQNVHKINDATKVSIADAEGAIRERKTIIELKGKDKADLSVRLQENLEKLARSKQNVEESSKPEVIRATREVMEERKRIETQIRVHQEENRDPDELLQSLRKRMQEIENLTQLKEANLRNFTAATSSIGMRREGFAALRSNTVGAVAATFSTVMRTMKMNGRIQIYLEDLVQDGEVVRKARTLDMQIDTHYTPSQRSGLVMNDSNSSNSAQQVQRQSSFSQPASSASRAKRSRRDPLADSSSSANEKENDLKMTDARSLSGGERSFSTVAFVLALWHHCNSPFKLMDEIDVFMDMVTRRVSYNALITFAKVTEDSGQFIFFSPLELPKFDNTDSLVRVFEMPSIIRKQTYPDSQPEAERSST